MVTMIVLSGLFLTPSCLINTLKIKERTSVHNHNNDNCNDHQLTFAVIYSYIIFLNVFSRRGCTCCKRAITFACMVRHSGSS